MLNYQEKNILTVLEILLYKSNKEVSSSSKAYKASKLYQVPVLLFSFNFNISLPISIAILYFPS